MLCLILIILQVLISFSMRKQRFGENIKLADGNTPIKSGVFKVHYIKVQISGKKHNQNISSDIL